MAILTVSREYGSGGREIGRAVADLIEYDYIDKQRILTEIAAAGHKWETWSKDLDERTPSVWEKYDWSFRGYGALIQSAILGYAVKDRVVIMGRGGNFVLKNIPHALRIHVVAPIDARVERIMERESVDRKTARWLAEKTDRERAGFHLALYGGQWSDPAEYDITFNTGVKTLNDIVLALKSLLLEKDRFATPEAFKMIEMRALAARIKAGLLTNPSFFLPTLDVDFDGKDIVLHGVVHNTKEHRKVEDEAKNLAGGQPIVCDLHYRD